MNSQEFEESITSLDYRISWNIIRYTKKYYKTKESYEKIIWSNDIITNINCAFNWSKSPEGHEFWSNVVFNISKEFILIEKICESLNFEKFKLLWIKKEYKYKSIEFKQKVLDCQNFTEFFVLIEFRSDLYFNHRFFKFLEKFRFLLF